MDWYEKHIEKDIRPLVKLLRNNGFNTESSCGHKMYVQCQNILDGELKRLHNLLYNNNYKNYEINMQLNCIDGCIFTTTNITLRDKINEIC
jgi:hypothetical protein